MDTFSMERISLVTALACNLNCKLCSIDAPYRRQEKNFTVEEQKRVVEKYFTVVDYVRKFSLTGGESLLLKDLPELLMYIKRYLNQIGQVELITNGTLIPSEALIEAAQSFGDKIIFLVDNYGPSLSKAIPSIKSALTNAHIPFTVRGNSSTSSHCDGWVDFSDGSELIHHTPEDVERVFSKCAVVQKLSFCCNFHNGVMYPCDQVRKCIQKGTTPDNPEEYVDFMDNTLSVKQLQSKIQHLYEINSLAACAYCTGMCDDSKRFVPAEQLTKEEIECVKQGARSYREVCEMMNPNNEYPTPPPYSLT